MDISNQEYDKLVKKASPPSKSYKTLPMAFAVGGGICVLGQMLNDGYTALGVKQSNCSAAVSEVNCDQALRSGSRTCPLAIKRRIAYFCIGLIFILFSPIHRSIEVFWRGETFRCGAFCLSIACCKSRGGTEEIRFDA